MNLRRKHRDRFDQVFERFLQDRVCPNKIQNHGHQSINKTKFRVLVVADFSVGRSLILKIQNSNKISRQNSH